MPLFVAHRWRNKTLPEMRGYGYQNSESRTKGETKRQDLKLILFISAFALYIANFHLCNIIAGDDMAEWYKWRGINYTAIFAMLFAAGNIGASGQTRFMLNIAFSIVVSDLIDRLFFDITSYQWKDLLTLILTLLTSFIVWKYKRN
jgi:hypothetical protein